MLIDLAPVSCSTVRYFGALSTVFYHCICIQPLGRFAQDSELSTLPGAQGQTLHSEPWDSPVLRTSSVASRHYSVSTKVNNVQLLLVNCLFSVTVFKFQSKFLSKEGWLAKTGGNNKVSFIGQESHIETACFIDTGMEGTLFCTCQWKTHLL